MNVFVLPCGISILENMRFRRDPWQKESRAPTAGADLEREAHDAWQAAGGTGQTINASYRQWVAAQSLFADRPLGNCSPKISAEVGSLASGTGAAGAPPSFDAGDTLVLLSSDSHSGVLAAHLNALAVGRPDPTYYDDPAELRGEVPSTVVVRVPRLVPDPAGAFMTDVAMGFAQALLWCRRARGCAKVVVHVAGGYKMAIPLLLGIVENLPAAKPEREAWCKHELGTGAVKLPLLQLERALCKELEVVHDNREPARTFDGYAYEWQGAWTLTDLGKALDRKICRHERLPDA